MGQKPVLDVEYGLERLTNYDWKRFFAGIVKLRRRFTEFVSLLVEQYQQFAVQTIQVRLDFPCIKSSAAFQASECGMYIMKDPWILTIVVTGTEPKPTPQIFYENRNSLTSAAFPRSFRCIHFVLHYERYCLCKISTPKQPVCQFSSRRSQTGVRFSCRKV